MHQPSPRPDTKREMLVDPKYAPPYPQNFYRFWPKHALKAGLVSVMAIGLILVLAAQLQVPTDPNMPPMPNEGANIPGPEWYLFFLFQPFWYFTDQYVWLRPLGTFWLPMLVIIGLAAIPFIAGRKQSCDGCSPTRSKKVTLAAGAMLIWMLGIGAVVGSGAPAKTTGCPSCHNPLMGERQSLPPANMGQFYRENRQQQIDVGKYRIGDVNGVGGSYKDANWQLRHYYEPTLTW
ncbi:MAG: hypothetical protein H7839_03110 [Magnetococcus sp. YQC-5]